MESKANQPNHSPLRMQQLWDILKPAQHQLNDLLIYRAGHKTNWIHMMMEILWEICPSTSETQSMAEQMLPQNTTDKNKRKVEELQNENNELVRENEKLKQVKQEMILKNKNQKISFMEREEILMKEIKKKVEELQNENNKLVRENEKLEQVKQEMILKNQKNSFMEREEILMKEIKKKEQQLTVYKQKLREQLRSKEKEMHSVKEENVKLKQIESSLQEDLATQEAEFKHEIESLQAHLILLRVKNENLKEKCVKAKLQLSELGQECESLGSRKTKEKLDQQKLKLDEMLVQHRQEQKTSTELDIKEIITHMPSSFQRQKNDDSMAKRELTKQNDFFEENEKLKEEITELKQQIRKLTEETTLKRKHTFKTVARIGSEITFRDENKAYAPVSYYKCADFQDELAKEREKVNELSNKLYEIQIEKKKIDDCCDKVNQDVKEKDQKLKRLKQHVSKLHTQMSTLKLHNEKLNQKLTNEKCYVGERKMLGIDDRITVLQMQEEIKKQRNNMSIRKDVRREVTENIYVGKNLKVGHFNRADAKLKETEKESRQVRKEIDGLQEDKNKQTQKFVEKENKLQNETEKIQKDLHKDILYLKSQLEEQRHQNETLAEAILNEKEEHRARESKLEAANAFKQKEKDLQIHKLLEEVETLQRNNQRQAEELKEKERGFQNEIENIKTNKNSEIRSLSSELESHRLEKEQYSDALRNARERYRKKKAAFEDKNVVLQEKLETLQTELNSVKTEVASKRELDKQYQMLQLEVDEHCTKHKQLTSELAEYQKKAFNKETDLKNKLHKLTTENQRLVKDLEHEKDITQRKMKLKDSESVSERFQNEDISTTQIVEELKAKLKSTTEKLQATKRELDDTKSRLSRIMGDRLTDNNPNVADLSDKNRPTKLSERCQELYDNQWTDAFETVSKLCDDEERTITTLQDILLDTMTFCKEEAEKQMTLIIKSLCKGTDIPPHLLKQLKDSRKALAEEYGRQLLQEYKKQLHKEDTEIAKISCKIPDFVEECFCICWLMAVQDPPVVFGARVERGADFNKDHYKAYTKGGDTVNYVVWPVLLLHEGGPVLCKGVAQGQMA